MSEFIKRKMTLAFYKFDVTKDGIVNQEDFDLYGQKTAEYLGFAADSVQYKEVASNVASIWDSYFKPADLNKDGKVTLDEWLSSIEEFAKVENAREIALERNRKFFDTLDLDGNGIIDLKEYKAFVVPMGVPEQMAEFAFSKLDLDGNGQITRDKFSQYLRDYYRSDDPNAVGNWFYGDY